MKRFTAWLSKIIQSAILSALKEHNNSNASDLVRLVESTETRAVDRIRFEAAQQGNVDPVDESFSIVVINRKTDKEHASTLERFAHNNDATEKYAELVLLSHVLATTETDDYYIVAVSRQNTIDKYKRQHETKITELQKGDFYMQ